MSADDKVVLGRVAILDKSGAPMTPTEGEAVPIDRKQRRDARNRMQDYATREEVMDGVAIGLKAVGDKMYLQMSEEIAGYLEDCMAEFNQKADERFQRLWAEMESRTLRGTLRALWRRMRRRQKPMVVSGRFDELLPSPEYVRESGSESA